jgi:hypothetical protein
VDETSTGTRGRRSLLRDPDVPLSTRLGLAFLGVVLVLLAIGLPTIGLVSHELGERHSTYSCTLQAVTSSPLRDGTAAWAVHTDCGGAIFIDPPDAGQTAAEGRSLARELRPGHRYRLTVKGVLHTPIDLSVDLLSAVPA